MDHRRGTARGCRFQASRSPNGSWGRGRDTAVVAHRFSGVSEPPCVFLVRKSPSPQGFFITACPTPNVELFWAPHVISPFLGEWGVMALQNRAAEYRRLGRECLALASSLTTEHARSILIEMARVWTRLANEQKLPSPPRATDLPQRALMQQQEQQQVRPETDGNPG
jgi:hypothetical protein